MFRALILVVALAGSAFAEPRIDAVNQIPNEPPGYCTWCAIESIGRQRGIAALIGLKEMRKEIGHPEGDPAKVETQLTALGVRFQQVKPGRQDFAFLAKVLAADRPIAVGLRNEEGKKHVVVLTNLSIDTVTFTEASLDGTAGVVILSRARFCELWDGWAVDVEPK